MQRAARAAGWHRTANQRIAGGYRERGRGGVGDGTLGHESLIVNDTDAYVSRALEGLA